MKPIKFEFQNTELDKPASMKDEECGSLPCYRDGVTVTSCWKMNWKQRLQALFCGKVWLTVYSGDSQPPVALQTESPFSIEDVYHQENLQEEQQTL